MKKLERIILIDDDEPTNFIHKIIIKETDCTHKVKDFLGAEEALEYFESRSLDDHFDNEIIFLDINMPCMNGWEFLDQYKKANSYDSPNSKIIMLTTSINPDDRQKADEYTNVYGFYNKPLSGQIIAEIVDQYFV